MAGVQSRALVVACCRTGCPRRPSVHFFLFYPDNGRSDGRGGFTELSRSGNTLVESQLSASRHRVGSVADGIENIRINLSTARIAAKMYERRRHDEIQSAAVDYSGATCVYLSLRAWNEADPPARGIEGTNNSAWAVHTIHRRGRDARCNRFILPWLLWIRTQVPGMMKRRASPFSGLPRLYAVCRMASAGHHKVHSSIRTTAVIPKRVTPEKSRSVYASDSKHYPSLRRISQLTAAGGVAQ